jgi:hypothetical protein
MHQYGYIALSRPFLANSVHVCMNSTSKMRCLAMLLFLIDNYTRRRSRVCFCIRWYRYVEKFKWGVKVELILCTRLGEATFSKTDQVWCMWEFMTLHGALERVTARRMVFGSPRESQNWPSYSIYCDDQRSGSNPTMRAFSSYLILPWRLVIRHSGWR